MPVPSFIARIQARRLRCWKFPEATIWLHPTLQPNLVRCPLGVLAHLQLGRAYALAGDTAKARAAYQDFLTLWKDADPEIPILKEAKAEYAKLQ